MSECSACSRSVSPANRLGLDYRAEAARLGAPVKPIIDIHTHVNGSRAASVYRRARDLFGASLTYSMTRLDDVAPVRAALGDTVRFIATPTYQSSDFKHAVTEGFLENIQRFHEMGSRIVKFWVAPRRRDFIEQAGLDPNDAGLDSEWTRRAMALGESLGMMFMTHVADPDTWFQTKYTDAARYGTKEAQYVPLERMLDRYTRPWIAAHMGGWPENLEFLSGLLERHPNLHLDTSACKWMVRELSKHPRTEFLEFLERWRGRILFGSDIVTMDAHLGAADDPFGKGAQASNENEAFDLYASRHWAFRTMFETSYEGESPIADPDLAMLDPGAHDELSAPLLRGHALPKELLASIYHDAAADLMDRWDRERAPSA